MAKISLKNFRKFESLDSLELGWINLFVGKNNAGKSTVVKAIMLALDNIRSLRWTNVKSEEGLLPQHYAPRPQFRFDANGFHNLHIGTFERAKCNYLDDRRITIALEYEGFEFKVTVAGTMEGGLVSMPIEKLKVSMPLHSNYEFDFSNNTMTFSLGAKLAHDPSDETQKSIWWVNDEIEMAENDIKAAAESGDALKAAELQQQLKKLQMRKKVLLAELKQLENKAGVDHATFDLSYFHETVGENILVQYLRTFVKLADSPINKVSGTGSALIPATKLKKNSTAYKEEVIKRQYVSEYRQEIEDAAKQLEKLLNNVYVEYIQAHAATQKLILSVDDKQDINSRVIHEYYQEGILAGERADMFVKKWLKNLEIGEAINIEPLDGEGYYVKVDTGDDDVHLADMGMGSIQLIILLLRLATIGNRSETTLRPWWVIIEEPEQNLHPMLQSKLADLFEDFTQTFCDPYSNTLIVETHSEYLIRRTQLFVAENGWDKEDLIFCNPFKVYYFPSEKGKQPYDMEYQTNGLFKQSFDDGFYDEAGRLALLRSAKESKEISSNDFDWNTL